MWKLVKGPDGDPLVNRVAELVVGQIKTHKRLSVKSGNKNSEMKRGSYRPAAKHKRRIEMKKIRVSSVLVIMLIAAMTLFVTPIRAEDRAADNMEIVREKIKADKKLLIAANMGLTEAEARAFWPVYEDYQKSLDKLNALTRKLVEDYAGSYESMSDMVAKAIVDDHLAIEMERTKLIQSYLPRFRQALPEKKVARYYQLENKIRAVVNFELARSIPLVR
jgi:hypothetical protein